MPRAETYMSIHSLTLRPPEDTSHARITMHDEASQGRSRDVVVTREIEPDAEICPSESISRLCGPMTAMHHQGVRGLIYFRARRGGSYVIREFPLGPPERAPDPFIYISLGSILGLERINATAWEWEPGRK